MSEQGFIGLSCIKGSKEDYSNQDDFGIKISSNGAIFAVFDGHGPCGEKLSNYTQQTLMTSVSDALIMGSPGSRDKALRDAFRNCDLACREHDALTGNKAEFDAYGSGTTATVVLITGRTLTVASVGDSRCIMGIEKKSNSGRYKCIELTRDHSCERKDERARIIKAGGVVKRLQGDIPFRVFLKGKSHPGLAMTRAIGDASGEGAGIIPIPEIWSRKLESDRSGMKSFIVIASDGVWEFLTSKEVVEIISKFSSDSAQAAVDAVVKTALERWTTFSPHAIDDITCIVCWLT